MRHYFDFPPDVRLAVETYASAKIANVDPSKFKQEPAYTAALAQSLKGIAYDGPNGLVTFDATIISDRGQHSAEWQSGADLAITAKISDGKTTIEKAILIQAKLGLVADLSPSRLQKLLDQIGKMKLRTRAPKAMEIVETNGVRRPRIISGNGLLANHRTLSVPLERYLATRVLTTSHGDTRPEFVAAVQESDLTQLRMIAER